MEFNRKSLIASSVLLISSFANAGLISDTDRDSFIDETTQLEWLDFGINNNQSYNYVASQLGNGGEYEGWSLATKGQVVEMWANAFLGLGASYQNENRYGAGQLWASDGNVNGASVFHPVTNMMGNNFIYNEGWGRTQEFAQGIFQGDNGIGTVTFKSYKDYIPQYTDNWYIESIVYLRDDYGHNHDDIDRLLNSPYKERSTMLVKAYTVLEPSSLAIFALGLMGLAVRRRKSF